MGALIEKAMGTALGPLKKSLASMTNLEAEVGAMRRELGLLKAGGGADQNGGGGKGGGGPATGRAAGDNPIQEDLGPRGGSKEAAPLVGLQRWAAEEGLGEDGLLFLTGEGLRTMKEVLSLRADDWVHIFNGLGPGSGGLRARLRIAVARLPLPEAENEAYGSNKDDRGEDFRGGGPLAELAGAASRLLGQQGGGGLPATAQGSGVTVPRAPPRPSWDQTTGAAGPATGAGAFGGSQGAEQGVTAGGRLVYGGEERTVVRRVALKVAKSQAAGLWEEWTNAGSVRAQEAVSSRTWKDHEKKRAAFDLGRALDVAKDSGLVIEDEPALEVVLRSLAALWFEDRHPKQSEVAELIRESSMNTFGVTRDLWEEVRGYRKLMSKATET